MNMIHVVLAAALAVGLILPAQAVRLPLRPEVTHTSLLEYEVVKDKVECALRIVAGVVDKDRFEMHDFVVGVDLGTARSTLSASKRTAPLERSTLAPINAWIAAGKENGVVLALDSVASDDKDGSIFGAVPLGDGLRILVALVKGETVLVGLPYRHEADPVIIKFSAELSARDRSKVIECLQAALPYASKQS